MTETTPRAPIDGVAMTAIGVAVIRVRESRRPDRLYDDPLAQWFVDAARRSFAETPDGAARWSRLEQLADQFYEGRTVAVRLVDDRVREAVEGGCGQVVILGAGLDTRAYRMALPAEVAVFELDLPELFAFKEPVLAAAGATPTCARHVIVADLREDWAETLCEAGFRADVPTHWVDEGALGYLPREDAMRALDTLTRLSAAGSRFGVPRGTVDMNEERYRELRSLVGPTGEQALRGLGAEAEDRLAAQGWQGSFLAWDDMVAPLGRPVVWGDGDRGVVLVVRD